MISARLKCWGSAFCSGVGCLSSSVLVVQIHQHLVADTDAWNQEGR